MQPIGILLLVINNRLTICFGVINNGQIVANFGIAFITIPIVTTATIFNSTNNSTACSMGLNSGLFALSGITITQIFKERTYDGINSGRRYIAIDV